MKREYRLNDKCLQLTGGAFCPRCEVEEPYYGYCKRCHTHLVPVLRDGQAESPEVSGKYYPVPISAFFPSMSKPMAFVDYYRYYDEDSSRQLYQFRAYLQERLNDWLRKYTIMTADDMRHTLDGLWLSLLDRAPGSIVLSAMGVLPIRVLGLREVEGRREGEGVQEFKDRVFSTPWREYNPWLAINKFIETIKTDHLPFQESILKGLTQAFDEPIDI